MKRHALAASVALVAALSVRARAQAPAPYGPYEDLFAGPGPFQGLDIELGGGVVNFASKAARGVSETGGTWNLRLKVGTRSWLGLEGSYVGTAQNVTEPGLDPSAYLLGNGLESGLRLALPTRREHWTVSPFFMVGLSWTHYTLENASFNTSNVGNHDDVYSVPVAAGLGGSVRSFSYDARLTYRPTFDDRILDNHDMSTLALTVDVGYAF